MGVGVLGVVEEGDVVLSKCVGCGVLGREFLSAVGGNGLAAPR